MSVLNIPTAEAFAPLLVPARDKGAFGGRGSGKSHFFAGLMIEDCLAEPGDTGEGLRSVCIREVQKDLAQSAKLLIETKLNDFGLGDADGFKVYRDVIRTPGDGILIFKGMNDYSADSIKSLEGFKRAWWEEAHGATATSIGLLRPTMRAPGSQMWWSWNPRRKKDPVDVMLRGPELPTGAIVVRASWRDNPWFTAELQQERRDCLRMTPDQYGHIWDGDYISIVDGAYYARSLADARANGQMGRLNRDKMFRMRVYADIGGTGLRADAAAWVVCQFVAREIRVLNYCEGQGQELSYYVNWLTAQGYTPDCTDIFLPHDGAQGDKVFATSYEKALRDAGYHVRVIPNQGKGAAMKRVEAGRRLFPQIYFDDAKTAALTEALGWYHEKKDEKREIGLGPEHDWASHGADAFGLMCSAYEPPRASLAQTVNVPNFGAV